MNDMSLDEAYNLLGVSQGATPDEINKAFRKASIKHHPDVNGGDDAMFKKINAAKQLLLDPPEQSGFGFNTGGFGGFGGFGPFDGFVNNINFNDFFTNTHRQTFVARNIELNHTISFKESVLGTETKLSFNRRSACQKCNGEGSLSVNNGCTQCNGTGFKTTKINGLGFIQEKCGSCHSPNRNACDVCNGFCVQSSNVSFDVKIPPGVHDGMKLKLRGVGDIITINHGRSIHADVLLKISVTPEEGLTLINQDVHSSIDISLLEAIKGTKKKVKTIFGNKQIKIPSKSKNKNQINVKGYGVNKQGSQIITINVQYPDNVEELISFLEQK